MILISDPILEKLNNASLKKIVLLKKNCYLLKACLTANVFFFAIHLFRIIKCFQYLIKLDFGTVPSVW